MYTIDVLSNNPVGTEVVRVDMWDSANRHWIYYFRRNDDDELELHTGAVTPRKSTEENFHSYPKATDAIQHIKEDGRFTLAEGEAQDE